MKNNEQTRQKYSLHLSFVWDSTADAMRITDTKGIIIDVNKSFCRLTGMNKKDIIGKKFSILYEKKYRTKFLGEFKSFVAGKKKFDMKEKKIEFLNGKKYFLEASYSRININNVSGILAVFRDISERKKIESALKESEKKYQTIFESTGTATLIINKDLTIAMANSECLRHTGYKPEELIGTKWMQYVHPSSVNDMIKYHKLRRKSPQLAPEKYEAKLINKNGEIRNSIIYVSMIPGTKQSIVSIFDITDRKKSEEALKDTELKFRSIFDNANDGILLADIKKKKFILANKSICKMLGYSQKELYKLYVNDIHPEEALQFVFEQFEKQSRKKISLAKDIPVLKKDGTVFYADISSNPVILGGKVHLLGIFRNVDDRKKYDEKIKNQAKRLNTILETLPDIMFIIDKDGFYKEFYTSEPDKLALPPDQIIGKNVTDVFGQKEGSMYINLFRKCIETKEQQKSEYTLSIDNKQFYFEARISRLDKEHVLTIIRDISENIMSHESDKSLKKQLRAVLDTVPSYIFAKDYDGKFLMVNKSLADLFGVLPDEVVGKSDADYGATEEQIEGYVTADRKVIDSGKPLLISEEQVLRPDGSLGWFQTNKVPYQHPGTDKPAILGVAVDITERKNAEEKLKESEKKYRDLYQSAEVALFDSGIIEARIKNCNRKFCEMFGFDSPEEAIGQSVLQLYVNPEHREVIRKIIEKSNFLDNYTVHFQNIKTERKFYGQLTMRIEEDGDKFVGSITDITNQMQTEQELLNAKEKAEEMNRLKTNFLANMSHEIRTPLNGILGFARILEDELNDPAFLEYTNAIRTSGLRLLETLDLILSFSKLEAEKVDMQYSNVKIEDSIDEVIFAFDIMAKNRNLYLRKEIKDNDIIAQTDERFLYQILNNLVNNAIKYTNEGGIIVELSQEDEEIIIKVKDTGIGIARDKFDIIFEEFRQESEGHGRSFEGTGLGLAITKKFVELMKGTIEVKSEVGVGSTFIVKLPYFKSSEPRKIKSRKEKPERKSGIPASKNKDKLTILVVEDDEMNLLYTLKALKDIYIIDSSTTGSDALKKTKKKVYDVVLMDINLGKGMNGLEVIEKIRKLPGYIKTPIVALTAFVLPGDREEFLSGGCTHYLGKPFTKNQILNLLNKISENL